MTRQRDWFRATGVIVLTAWAGGIAMYADIVELPAALEPLRAIAMAPPK